jgi:predicted phosphodiesterase
MSANKLTNAQCQEVLDALEKAGGVKVAAATLLNIPVNTFRSRLNEAMRRGGKAIEPDKPEDPIEVRRSKSRETLQRQKIEELEKAAAANRTIREAVLNLSERPLEPPNWNPKPSKSKGARETIVLFLSDIHMGEVVDAQSMGGRNSYNMKIACARIERYFQNVVKLGTEHWTGPPPDAIYLVLGGDLVSGEIHEELARTNDLQAIPAVRVLAEALAAGILLLRNAFPAMPIHVLSVPGNHGRNTKKPEAKSFAVNSYDTLVALLLEWWASTKGVKNVTFSSPRTGDAVVQIHGWNFLFTHGDRIGSRGGSGFVGPAATAARGMQKLIQDYLSEGVVIDVIVMGHFHTPLELEHGFVNSSLVGPSEYSRSGRMKSHASAQWMLTVHPQYGVARRWKIACGDKSEGSIYHGRTA